MTTSKEDLEEYIDTLGLDVVFQGDLGNHRGLNPRLTEAQMNAWENLAAKLSYGHARGKSAGAVDEDEDDEDTEVDVLLSPHAILHESNLNKRSHTSMVGHTSKRHLILLNDALLITKPTSSGIMKTSESFSVRQSFHLNKISLRDLANFGDDSKLAFEILTSKRPYVLVADTESEKRIWLEELTLALYAVYQTSPEPSPLGWQHLAVRGTMHSLAFMGEMENFISFIGKFESSSIDALDSSGMSALHWAALGGHSDIAQIILEHGGDPNILNSGLNSPLHLAASSGHSTTVQVLLDFQADLSLRNMKDRDAMYMAVLYCRREKLLENVLKLFFVKGVDLNQFDSSGSAPLHECASRGLSKAIKFLVDEEANVNLSHQVSGLTPLQIATSVPFPHAETVRSLLENGAHVNQTNKNGKNPFASVLEQYILSLNDSSYDRERVVETVLATLQELARAGARFIDDDLKLLRASFKDAIISARQAWIELEPPDYFSEYSIAGSLVIEKDEWTADSASTYCPLCSAKFTMSFRRHHCRSCGTLCCSLCSNKKLLLAPRGSAKGLTTAAPTPTTAKTVGERVCDSCFNKHIYEARRSKQRRAFSISNAATTSTSISTSDTTRTVSPPPSNDASATSVTREALDQLQKRGQLLEATKEQSDALEEGASDFKRMTAELLKQQKRGIW